MTDTTGTTRYGYDNADRLKTVTDGNGSVVGYDYDNSDLLKTLTYPDGRVVSYDRNGAGQVSTLTDDTTVAGGQVTTFGYSADGTPITANLPSGNVITTGLNGEDQPIGIALKNGAGSVLAQVGYGYDHANRIASETDTGALAGGTSYGYDPAGRLATSTDTTTGTTANYGYDATGNPTQIGGTTQAFDGSSQLQTSTTGGAQTSYGYDTDGNLAGITPPAGVGSQFGYTRSNRMRSATTPATDANKSLYHPLPVTRFADTTRGTGTCTPSPCATLAANGSVTIAVAGHGGVPGTGANAVTLVITTLNNTSSGYLRVAADGEQLPDGRSMTSVANVDQTDTVITKVGADGNINIFSSVATDLLVDVVGWYTDPDTVPDSGASAFVPIDGTRILDTRSGSAIGTCTPSPCATLSAGGITTVQVGGKAGVPTSGVAAAVYTLTAVNPSVDGYAVAWQTGTTRPSNRSMTYTASVNSSDLIVTPLSAAGQLNLYSSKAADFVLDLAGYYTTNANGTGSYFVPANPALGTDSRRILDTRASTNIGTCTPSPCSTLQSSSPTTINIAGEGPVPATGVSSVVVAATVLYTSNTTGLSIYPADGTAAGRDMSYVAGQNSTATIVSRLSSQGQIKAFPFAGTTDLLLDVQGWYQSVGTNTQTYEYNADGLRTSKTDTANGDVTHFVYDTTTATHQLLTDGTTDYIYSPTGALLETAPTRGSPGTRAFVLSDALGSTRAISDSTGAVTGTYKYSPYGTVTTHTGASILLQYAGGYTDAETGLTYYINRYYSPNNGTFTTVDPALDITNQPYAYAANNPVNSTDPNGDCPWCIAAAVGFVSGAAIDFGSQVIGNWIQGCPAFSNISWGEVVKSGLAGAAFDGLGAVAVDLFRAGRVGLSAAEDGGLLSRLRALPEDERGAIGLPSRGPISPNQMNRAIERGQAPRGLVRVDTGKIPGEQTHIHLEDGSALNLDGTWKHGGTTLTNAQTKWLQQNGWKIP